MMKKRALPLVVILACLLLPTPAPAFPLMGMGWVRQIAEVSEALGRALIRAERRVRGEKPQTKEGSCVDPDGRPRPCR